MVVIDWEMVGHMSSTESANSKEKGQGRGQDFLKEGSRTNIELPEVGIWGHSPQLLRDFQYFNESKLSKLLYFM